MKTEDSMLKRLRELTKDIPKEPISFKLRKDDSPRSHQKRGYKGYKICDNPSCFCTGNCISRGELNKARAIVKEFGQ